MSVVVSIEDLGGSQKRVKVEVPAPAVTAETERITAEYRKHAKVSGFRKGKVPNSLVLKRFGEDIERHAAAQDEVLRHRRLVLRIDDAHERQAAADGTRHLAVDAGEALERVVVEDAL